MEANEERTLMKSPSILAQQLICKFGILEHIVSFVSFGTDACRVGCDANLRSHFLRPRQVFWQPSYNNRSL
jgi:hypothetical protein